MVELGITYHHRQTIGHSNEISTAVGGPLLREVAQARRAGALPLKSWFMVFKAKLPGVFADNSHVLPTKALEPPSGNFAEGWREVYKVDTIEKGRHIHKLCHRLDVETGPASNLGEHTHSAIAFIV